MRVRGLLGVGVLMVACTASPVSAAPEPPPAYPPDAGGEVVGLVCHNFADRAGCEPFLRQWAWAERCSGHNPWCLLNDDGTPMRFSSPQTGAAAFTCQLDTATVVSCPPRQHQYPTISGLLAGRVVTPTDLLDDLHRWCHSCLTDEASYTRGLAAQVTAWQTDVL